MFTSEDIELATRAIFDGQVINTESNNFNNGNDESHNKFAGLMWGLLSKGDIFSKIISHPIIKEVSVKLLGKNCRLSSLASSTVMPGMKGQKPHLDYPYYRHMWPEGETSMNHSPENLLSLQVVTLLTEFTPENGSTAIVPGSHLVPRHPDDVDEFFSKAIQLTANAGDVLMFSGPIQHCAMPNNSTKLRCGILQHMCPLYVVPFENIPPTGEENEEMRRILALDTPYPILKKK